MTINDLIEKLKSEKLNGAYTLLRTWQADIKKLRKEAEDAKGTKRWLSIEDRIDEKYYSSSGFIWGLLAVGCISDSECSELLDELIEAANG